MRIYFSSDCNDGDYFICRLRPSPDGTASWEEIDKMQPEEHSFGAGTIFFADLVAPGVYGIRRHYSERMYCCMLALRSELSLTITEVTDERAKHLLAALPMLQ